MPKINIDKGRINYQWVNVNSQSEEVIVFLHEALGSIPQWKDFPEILCRNLNMKGLVYERLGYGNSDPDLSFRSVDYLKDFALKEMPQVLKSLISEINKVHLVGHSDGGSIALIYASRFPQQIVSLTTMAAHVFNEEVTIAGIQPAIDAYKRGKLDGLKKYHGDKTEHLFYNWSRTWLTEEYKEWNIESYLNGISAPSLIIQGINDQYGTEKQVDAIVSQVSVEGKKCMIEDCGHAPHLEKKELIVETISNFIKSQNGN